MADASEEKGKIMKGIYKNIVLPFMVILLTGCSTDSGMDQEMGSHLNHKGTVADIQAENVVESTESESVQPENPLISLRTLFMTVRSKIYRVSWQAGSIFFFMAIPRMAHIIFIL